MDLAESEEQLEMFKTRFPKVQIIPISAQEETGLEELKAVLLEKVGKRKDH